MVERPALVLFDLDGVLVDYDRGARARHLAAAADCSEADVRQALFGSGLEARFDAGSVDTTDYLGELGAALSHAVDVALWTAARAAAVRVDDATPALLAQVATRCDIAVLTNNGQLLVEQLPAIAPGLFPLLEGRVLCSASLGHRKPSAQAFRGALERLGHRAIETLFLDDLQDNVDGARAAGLRAERVESPAHLRGALARHGLA